MLSIFHFYCIQLLIYNLFGLPIKIPIGIVFEQGTIEAQEALKSALFLHNNNPNAMFKLEAQVDVISTTDVFKISRIICKRFSQGVFTLIGMIHPDTYDVFHSYSNTFKIPFIAPYFPLNSDQSNSEINFSVSLRPDYSHAMLDIIKFYGWKKIIYLYESNAGLLRLQLLFNQISGKNRLEFYIVQHIYNETDVVDMLTTLEEDTRFRESKHFIILDCNQQLAQKVIISHVSSKWLGRRIYHYLFSDLIFDDGWDSKVIEFGSINITGFKIVDWTDEKVQNIFHASKISNPDETIAFKINYTSSAAALMFDSVQLFITALNTFIKQNTSTFQKIQNQIIQNDSTECFELEKSKIGIHVLDSLRKVSVNGITGNISFDNDGKRTNFSLQIVEMTPTRKLEQIGTWKYDEGLSITSPKYLTAKSNFEINRTFIVTTILDEPYLMLRESTKDQIFEGNDRFHGYCKDLADKIAKRLNFEYIFKLVKDSRFGGVNSDGKWNGMVGELLAKEADIAIAPLTITSNREKVIDFTKPYMTLGISIMIKKPVKQKPGLLSFMKPLSIEIWLCVLLAFIGVSAVLYFVTRFNIRDKKKTDNTNTETNALTIYNSLWFSFAALMQQGCDVMPKCLSGRIVVSFWWFFSLIIISSYTANLAAVLTVERMVTTINSADDLAKQTEIEYGLLKGGSTEDFFKNSQNPIHQKMWMFMNERTHVFLPTQEDGVNKVRNSSGKFALLVESTVNNYQNERMPCTTMRVGENLDTKGYGIATPRDNEYTNLKLRLNLAVLELIESGTLTRLEKKWWYDRSECSTLNENGSGHNELTLINLAGIFYFLVAGLLLSIGVALTEFYYKFFRKKKNVFNVH